jgi:hypothetical protein
MPQNRDSESELEARLEKIDAKLAQSENMGAKRGAQL